MTGSSDPPREIELRVGDHAFPIEPDRIYILGSDERCNLRLRHGSVSPHHASFSLHRGELLLEDLGSVTGTWVGGVRVAKSALEPGARFRLGSIEVDVVAAARAAASVAATATGAAVAGEPGGRAVAAPAAVSSTGIVAPISSRPLHAWRDEETFAEIMAAELRRTPWFTLSLLLHALVLWLLYLWMIPPEIGPDGRMALVLADEAVDDASAVDEAPTEDVEVEQARADEEQAEIDREDMRSAFEETARFDDPTDHLDVDFLGPEEAWRTQLRSGGGGDILAAGGARGLSDGFRATVGEARRAGLEIVFVVDSTGSMDPVIQASKRCLVRMLDVLHALVPNARVGIATYRDRGRNEEYVTRTLPLGRDHYRALNFMATIDSRGGGDRPEAVLEGLTAAIEQKWRGGAQRVVVLIGDAPAHEGSSQRIDSLVKRFTSDGRSHVHTIMTSPDMLGAIEADTRESFTRIARAGRGSCVPFEKEDAILQQVLALAFGEENRRSLDEVYALVDERTREIPAQYRDMVRRADAEAIETELRRLTVPDALVRALAESRDPAVARVLVGVLTRPQFPDTGRQAAAWALQRVLDLRTPPIEPEHNGPVRGEIASRLRRALRD